MTEDEHVTDLTRVALLMMRFNHSEVRELLMENVADLLTDPEFIEEKVFALAEMVRLSLCVLLTLSQLAKLS